MSKTTVRSEGELQSPAILGGRCAHVFAKSRGKGGRRLVAGRQRNITDAHRRIREQLARIHFNGTIPIVRTVPDPSATSRQTLLALSQLQSIAAPACYALLRIVFGNVLITHGIPKLLRTSHGSMADPMAGSINLIENVLHLPAPPVLAMVVALLEGLGGALLAIGFGTRIIAAMVTVQMLAICVALGPTWPWIDRGIEFPFLMMFLALFMALNGGG